MSLTKVEKGQKQKAADLNAIIDAINPLLNLKVGNGLELKKSAAGVQITLARQLKSRPAGGGTSGSVDDPTGLAWLQGTRDTDSWTRGGETPTPVSFHVLTDIKFNDTDDEALTLTMRSRTLLFDSAGALYSVSAEDEYETTITTAVLCAESP
jgi:hypothetical protein